MTTIDKIEQRLQNHLGLSYEVAGSSVTVNAPTADGFSVSLIERPPEWIVHFDGWHEHFDCEDAALNCFAFGLSDECRLQITLRGDFPYRWTVQSQVPDGWACDSTTALFLFPFWRPRRVQYRQNNVWNSGWE